MIEIKDAPWIREAEQNGMPDVPDYACPVCGAENPDSYFIRDGEILGCSDCVKIRDAWEWTTEQAEDWQE